MTSAFSTSSLVISGLEPALPREQRIDDPIKNPYQGIAAGIAFLLEGYPGSVNFKVIEGPSILYGPPHSRGLIGVHRIRPRSVDSPAIHELGVFSVVDRSWNQVPPMSLDGGIRSQCQCISLAGSIYVLGGLQHNYPSACNDVYRFDLRTGQWSNCSSMLYPRMSFGVCILHGKIYALGGWDGYAPVHECEVYDPQVNVWSNCNTHLESRIDHQVSVRGETLCLYGGTHLEDPRDLHDHSEENEDSNENSGSEDEISNQDSFSDGSLTDDSEEHEAFGGYLRVYPSYRIDVYDLRLNSWSWITIAGESIPNQEVFIIQGEIYRLTDTGIDVHYGNDTNAVTNRQPWSPLHVFGSRILSEGVTQLSDLSFNYGSKTILVAGELLIVGCLSRHAQAPEACLFLTRGFRRDLMMIELEIVRLSLGQITHDSTTVFLIDK